MPATAAREAGPAVEKFATPGVVTIEALSKKPHKVPANRQIKTLVYLADSKPVIILIRGDDQLNETKFMARADAVAARPAAPEEIFDLLGAHPGSLGAVASTLESRAGISPAPDGDPPLLPCPSSLTNACAARMT